MLVIYIDPGTYTHSDPKSKKEKNDITGTRLGFELCHPKMEKRIPYQFPPGVETSPPQNGKKYLHSRGQTHNKNMVTGKHHNMDFFKRFAVHKYPSIFGVLKSMSPGHPSPFK